MGEAMAPLGGEAVHAVRGRGETLEGGDVMRLRIAPVDLARRIADLRRARAAWRRAKRAHAWATIRFWGAVFAICAALTAAGWLAPERLVGRDVAGLLLVVAMLAAVSGLVAVIAALWAVPGLFAYDPWGAWLERLYAWLERVRPELAPGADLLLLLDLRDIGEAPTYRTATSPYSQAPKSWHHARRLGLRLVLADGTRFAWEAVERAKFKRDSRLWTRGHTRVRIERPGWLPRRRPPAGFQVLLERGQLLAWRATSRQDAELPDLAAWRGMFEADV